MADQTEVERREFEADPRTNLCFAATNSRHEGYQITSITNVPCTDAVEKIIRQ